MTFIRFDGTKNLLSTRGRRLSDTNALGLGLALQTLLLLCGLFFANSAVVQSAAVYVFADGQTDYLAGLACGLALSFSLFLWPIARSEKLVLLLLWQAKLLICLVLMLYYEAYFVELDAFGYFNRARSEQYFLGLSLGDGSENITELCKLLLAVLPDSYHLLKVLFAYFGLIAIFVIYRTICTVIGRDNLMWLAALGLFPSILFWSSILGKDPVSLLGVAIAFLGMAKLSRGKFWIGLAYVAAGILLVAYIRIWLSLILLVPAMVIVLRGVKSMITQAIIVVAAVLMGALLVATFNEKFEIESRRDAVEKYDTLSRNWSDMGGSSQVIEANLTDPVQLLAFTPLAAFTALYRPLPLEIGSLFGTLSGLENLFLLLLTIRAIARFKLSMLRNREVLAVAMFLFVWVVIYGPISYQNLGTAVRFKLQILPIFLALLIYFGRKVPLPVSLGTNAHSIASQVPRTR